LGSGLGLGRQWGVGGDGCRARSGGGAAGTARLETPGRKCIVTGRGSKKVHNLVP
jgi:hypothetical protein